MTLTAAILRVKAARKVVRKVKAPRRARKAARKDKKVPARAASMLVRWHYSC